MPTNARNERKSQKFFMNEPTKVARHHRVRPNTIILVRSYLNEGDICIILRPTLKSVRSLNFLARFK